MSTTTAWTPRPTSSSTRWVAAKWLVLLAYLLTIVAAFLVPDETARAFWFIVVPLLPASFLLNAELWRNVCPLATLNTLVTNRDGGRPLDKKTAKIATVLGIGLLLLAIPARHVLLNESGAATGALLAAAGLMALVSGLRFQRKAGFCNSVCPILPIERLYGQRPLVVTENARCTPCHVCTRAACYDLSPGRSALQTLGAGAAGRRWMLMPFGAFALALPGVIAGYYVAPAFADRAINPYVTVAFAATVSWLLLASSARVFHVRPASGLLWTAVLSVGLYYWFTPAAVAEAYGLPGWLSVALTGVALALVAYWAWRSLVADSKRVGQARRELPTRSHYLR